MTYTEEKIFNENIAEIVKSLEAYFRSHAQHVIVESKGEHCPFGCVINTRNGISFIFAAGDSEVLKPVATIARIVSNGRTPVEGCHKISKSSSHDEEVGK